MINNLNAISIPHTLIRTYLDITYPSLSVLNRDEYMFKYIISLGLDTA